MSLSRVKNWIAEILTFSDLNAEFNNILNNPGSLITPITFDLTFTDATYDIGKTGATRPRDLFLSRNAVIGGTVAIRDTSAAYDVTLAAVSSAALTAGRTLTLDMGNVAHTLAFGTTANTITFPNAASGTVPLLNLAQTFTAAQTFTSAAPQLTLGVNATTLGSIKLFGNTSGNITLQPAAAAGTDVVITFPATSVTLNAAGSLTGTTLASNVVTTSITTVGTITSGVWNAGAVTSSGAISGTTVTGTTSIQSGAAGVNGVYGASGLTVTAGGNVASVSGNIQYFTNATLTPSSTQSGVRISAVADINTSIWSGGASSASQKHISFVNTNGEVGNITTSNTATAFNTSSDKRLKTVFNLATDTSVLKALEVWDGEWKANKRKDRFLLAQHVYLIKPSVVSVGNDEPDEGGKLMNPWSIDYSKFVPELIVGWHDHERRLAALEQRQ